jgi:acetylornithine deacetylase/succinyl-diaminopimelate desuccinylase-like protein
VAIPSFDDEELVLRALDELLRIPSISREPARAGDMRRAADWLAGRLGFAGGEVLETGGQPVVLGEWLGKPGAPTVLVYGHYDVQPPGDLAEWETPPFEPAIRDGRIYARGATDDKGPLLIPLAVAEAFLADRGELPVNVRFLIEGEEEVGSPSLPGFLRANAERLAADLVVSADGAMWRPSEPSLTIAARGLVGLDLVVTGARSDLHSGRHGGAIPNPLRALATILAGLHRPDGAVAVEGFYEDVRPLSEDDRAALLAIPFDEEAYRSEIGAQALAGEPGFTALERIWTRPTLEINGLRGGGDLTVIPGEARAHVTCRLVPDQRPVAVLEAVARHVALHCPPGVTVSVLPEADGVPAYSIAADHPGVLAARDALRRVYPGVEPLVVRMGGTLPAASIMGAVLGLETVFFSFSSGDEGLHAPNEFFRLSRLREGLQAWAHLFELLAA